MAAEADDEVAAEKVDGAAAEVVVEEADKPTLSSRVRVEVVEHVERVELDERDEASGTRARGR